MYTPPTPDSPPTPPTPDWVRQQRLEDERRVQEEINRKRGYIDLISDCLKKLPKGEPKDYLIWLINSNKDLDKRYAIAEAINATTADKDLYDQETQSQIIKQLKDDVFDTKSALYKALNIQRSSILRFTLFGKMHWLSWNCAQSLQEAQSITREQNTIKNTNSI